MSYKCGHPQVNILLNNDSGCISNVDRLLLAPVFQGRGTCQPRCQPVGWVSWYPQWTREACWAPCLWPGTTSDRKRERWGQKQERSEYTEKLVKRKKKKKYRVSCVRFAGRTWKVRFNGWKLHSLSSSWTKREESMEFPYMKELGVTTLVPQHWRRGQTIEQSLKK